MSWIDGMRKALARRWGTDLLASTSPVRGTVQEATLVRLVASGVAAAAQAAVQEAGYAEHSPEHRDALKRQCVAQVEAAAPLPIDPAARSDAWALRTVEELFGRLAAARETVSRTKQSRADSRQRLLAQRMHLSAGRRACLIALLFALTLMTAAAVALLARPALHLAVVGPYFWRVAHIEGGAVATQALLLSLLLSGSFVTWQAVTVVWGRGSVLGKISLAAADVLFTAAFALARTGSHITARGLSASAYELALLLVGLTGLHAVAARLRSELILREPYEQALAEVALREEEHQEALRDATELEARLHQQLAAIEQREDAVRRLPAQRALVESTVEAAYIRATSDLINQQLEGVEESNAALAAVLEQRLPQAVAAHSVATRSTEAS